MRFDELILKVPGDELRVKFHPRMTVLSGLGAPEREALARSIVGALTGGSQETALRYFDGTGRLVNALAGPNTPVRTRHEDDGSPASAPLSGAVSPTDLAALMLVQASDLGVQNRPPRGDEPPELRDARVSLEEITAQLEEVLEEERAADAVRTELIALDEQLHLAHDGAARRQYAEVLARLERVRSEATTLQSGTAGIETDRHLLDNAERATELAECWRVAAEELGRIVERVGSDERLDHDVCVEAATLPDAPPADLSALVAAAVEAETIRAALDNRLQTLAVAKLPAPTDALAGELGLLDQHEVWSAADRLIAAIDELHRVQMSLGGLGGDDGGPAPAVIERMEIAHADLEAAEQAADTLRVRGFAGTGLGVALALAGSIGATILLPVGLLVAGGIGTWAIALPRRRVAKAAATERAAFEEAGVPSYLGFHLRRVDATVDPNVRVNVEAAAKEHRAATVAWVALVGAGVDVQQAKALEAEVQEYHTALRSLGGAADEIEQLRTDLAEHAEPAVTATRAALGEACAPYGISAESIHDPSTAASQVAAAIRLGQAARLQGDLSQAESREQDAVRDLDAHLRQLGFDDGELDARISALDGAVTRATEREEARANGRPIAQVEAELLSLQQTAGRLRRPEWATVSPSEADEPDIEQLEERREKLRAQLDEVQPGVDVVRLADRQAAMERRVMALEARHGGHDANGDPGAVADIQQHLLGRLTQASAAGPHGDPLPAVLDEVFLRVPAERKWDLLDLLHRLSERHQLIYLSDDPFVAAWASQHRSDEVSLLAPAPESV